MGPGKFAVGRRDQEQGIAEVGFLDAGLTEFACSSSRASRHA